MVIIVDYLVFVCDGGFENGYVVVGVVKFGIMGECVDQVDVVYVLGYNKFFLGSW